MTIPASWAWNGCAGPSKRAACGAGIVMTRRRVEIVSAPVSSIQSGPSRWRPVTSTPCRTCSAEANAFGRPDIPGKPTKRGSGPSSSHGAIAVAMVSTRAEKSGSRAVKYWAPWSKLRSCPPMRMRRVAIRPPTPRPLSRMTGFCPAFARCWPQAKPAIPDPRMTVSATDACSMLSVMREGHGKPARNSKGMRQNGQGCCGICSRFLQDFPAA